MKNTCLFLVLIFVIGFGFSQNTKPVTKKNSTPYKRAKKLENPFVTKKGINSQFDYIYKKSGTYKEYKVLKITLYNTLKNSVLDSIKLQKNTIQQKNSVIDGHQLEIATLQQKLLTTENSLGKALKAQKSRSVLGISVHKITFTVIITSSYIILMLLLGLFVYKYNQNISNTKKAIKNLKDIEVEYSAHKKNALKRFQEVNRKLQDELNKNWKKSQ